MTVRVQLTTARAAMVDGLTWTADTTRPAAELIHSVSNERDESVWLPLSSMASTSQSYARRGHRGSRSGHSMCVVVVGGRYCSARTCDHVRMRRRVLLDDER
jgi:hypothetical protein